MSDEMQAPRARRSSRVTDAGGVGILEERPTLVFPGQGSQFVGMGRDIYESSPAGRAVFDEADDILRFPISQLCFDGPEEERTAGPGHSGSSSLPADAPRAIESCRKSIWLR